MSQKQVILITGASLGIGKACATYLQRKGYRVYGTSRRARPPTENGPEPAPTRSEPFEMIQMDVDDDASVQCGVHFVLQNEGRLDVVVNNAGFEASGSVEDTSIEEAKAQLETNFFGVFRVCRAVLPTMRARGCGCIVNISSVCGVFGVPFHGLYSASKFAVEGMTEVLSMEVQPFGIRVVLIEPGDFHTGLTANRRWAVASRADSAYRERCERAIGVMKSDEVNGASPEPIARLVERIINSRHPRLRYTVGPLYEKAAIILKRVLPSRLFEWALAKYYKLH